MSYGYETSGPAGQAPPVPPVPGSGGPARLARSSGATLGVLLVVMGAAFLVAQFLPGMEWWTLWPLAIVVLGLIQMVTPSLVNGWGVERVAEGIGTVLLGLLLLGNTTGYIAWSVWWTLLGLWPVLLISAGIALLGKASGQEWLRALASIPVWIALVYAAALAWTGAPLPFEVAPLPFSLYTITVPPAHPFP